MHNQKTTHILLTLATVSMLILASLLLQQQFAHRLALDTKSVPVRNVIPSIPDSNPKKLPVNIQDISKGDTVTLGYVSDGPGIYSEVAGEPYVFCEKKIEGGWDFADKVENCGNLEWMVWVGTDELQVTLKDGVDKGVLYALNREYNVAIVDEGNHYMYPEIRKYLLTLRTPTYSNSIALAKIYFETGYFDKVEPSTSYWTN